ncbi:cytochrome b5-like heme steroid binding domain-containing protein [Colletotrichum truncatum]|uniref:Cytochrome b5-like heme steroid binding domain-containing protein n=1 Tax=Colletotrichum truncatum TaxID=5467 RepID=A0ACC3YDG5_COLTU
MEAVFAPALSAMALAQSGVLADQPDLVAHCLENLAARIVKCAHVFDAMTPRDTTRFDPVIWIKTYPAMGQAVTSGELGNSGVDVPLFHALDAFIGRKDVKGDLKGMQSDRRAKLPVNICAFLDALGNEAGSVRDYVAGACARLHYLSPDEQSQYRHLSAAWDGLLQMYVWFLERHRVKAVGVTGVSLSTGRHSTSSGVQSSDQDKCLTAGKPKMRPETMLSMQMKKGMASRLGGRPLWQDAYIQSQSVYEGTVVVTVRLDANLPLKSGDRVQVWPPRKRKNVKRTSSHQRRLRGSSPEDQDVSSEEGDDDVEPRFYSIARVIPDTEGRGMAITLTVGQHSPEGLVSSFLSNSAQGTHLRLRPWPSPRFRQPRDMTLPLVLIGQGSGIGPFVGFLHDRVAARHRLDDTQDDMGEMGEVLFVIAAKTLRHVPCPLDSLEELTKALPLTIILALSQETHQMIRSGVWTELPQGDRHVTSHLLEYRDFVQRLVKEKNGHVFVCGTSEFGATVMSDLGLDQTQQQQQQRQKQQAKDLNDESYNNNRTKIPSPPDLWDQVHQDLFNAVKKPLISRSSSSPSSSPTDLKTPVISLSELAAHNSITSCWIAIDGIVYDMTSFLTTHPGGPKTLLESAGTIADARFAETHGGPHVQEIRGYLQRYTVGRLSTVTADSPGTQMTTSKIIDALVKMQNALTNNATFEASRGPVPLYVYQDALLVFADGLDGVAGILSDVSSDGISSELRETILKTQALLRRAFTVLKNGCKGFLVAAGSKGARSRSSALLDESEDLIQRLYREPIQKVHSAIDACKKDLGEMKTVTNADCSCKNYNVHEDENAQVLRCALDKFCISLASVAEDLLY